MENGSQCVGMKECKTDTVAMPPIVETSFAISAIIFFPSKILKKKKLLVSLASTQYWTLQGLLACGFKITTKSC
jgi:hypothetical protein